MKNKGEGLGIRGHVRAWITDNATGKKRLVFDNHNAVLAAYAEEIVDALVLNTVDYALDNRFNGNTNLGAGNDGEDGIAIKENGGLWYEMNMETPVVSGDQITFVGTFTGVLVTITAAADVKLGHNWVNAGLDFEGGVGLYANPAGWASQTIQIAETLTIEWIISHEVS